MKRPRPAPDRSRADRAARLAALEREHAGALAHLPPALLLRLDAIEGEIAALRLSLAGDHPPPGAGR